MNQTHQAMILHLWHGRKSPNEELDGWGFNGPTFRDVKKITVSKDNRIEIFGANDEGKLNLIDTVTYDAYANIFCHNNSYYGDISIASHEDNRECKDECVVKHSEGATLFSWLQLTYGGRDRCGSSVCEEDPIPQIQEGSFEVVPLDSFEGEYKLHLGNLESFKSSLRCSCHNLYRLETQDLFGDDDDIEAARQEGLSADDTVEKRGKKYDLANLQVVVMPNELKATYNRDKLKENK